MLTNFKIDQAATFAGVVFLSSSPKLEMGSKSQAKTKDGLPKWEVEVLGAVRDNFDPTKVNNSVLKIGIASYQDPSEGLGPFTPVVLPDLEIGVMEKTKRNPDGSEKIIGTTVWFRASGIRSTAETMVTPPSGRAA